MIDDCLPCHELRNNLVEGLEKFRQKAINSWPQMIHCRKLFLACEKLSEIYLQKLSHRKHFSLLIKQKLISAGAKISAAG